MCPLLLFHGGTWKYCLWKIVLQSHIRKIKNELPTKSHYVWDGIVTYPSGFITWSDTKPEEQSSDVPAVAEYTLGMTHQEKDTPPASMFLQNRCPLVPVSHGGLTYLRYKWDTSQNPDFPRNIGGKNAMGFGYRTVDKSIEIQGLVTPHSPLLW
jgi:hypothetical protein